MPDRLEVGTASALAGAAVFSIHGIYAQHAGSLADCRNAPAGDPQTAARLMDADILTGSICAVVGGMLTAVTRRKEPLVMAMVVFGITATYYHLVCYSPSVNEVSENGY